MAAAYILIGSASIAAAIVFNLLGTKDVFLFWLGGIVYALAVLVVFWGYYAESNKLISVACKLLRTELKPAEFIYEYEKLNRSADLIVKKPSAQLLNEVIIAYVVLDDKERSLAMAEEMIAAADNDNKEKNKAYARLVKASLLFSYGEAEEGERLFNEARKFKFDFICQAIADAILKDDRAMAREDYTVAEAHNLKLLEKSFPKLDNLGKVLVHYRLGEIYEKLQDKEKAIFHYGYCSEHGGDTALKEKSKAAIERLK